MEAAKPEIHQLGMAKADRKNRPRCHKTKKFPEIHIFVTILA